ncbi:MAG: hypothetical protein ACKVII_05020 [Planctomycetales bacterium]|jgi:hypothetical protein
MKQEPKPRSGDSDHLCCRRFAAHMFKLILFRGLTPTAMCCHRYAAGVNTLNKAASD